MAVTINEDDPCEAAKLLRAVYVNLVSGAQAQIVTFKGGVTGVERSATFHKASPDRLLVLIRQFEDRCAALNNARPRRFAVRGGGM